MAPEMNSGPLSLRMCWGTPRVRNKFVSTSTIRSALMLRSTSKAKHSRVYSSVIAKPLQRSACGCPIVDKVPGPDMVLVLGLVAQTTVTVVTETSLFHALTRHFQPFLSTQSLDSFEVHAAAFLT